MRLPEIDRGDTLGHRALIGIISMVSGMRLPDAARVAFYHREFLAGALGAWTQKVMRGASSWSIGERELIAAMVAKWNSSAFCTGAHRAIAIKGLSPSLAPSVVDAALEDYRSAALPEGLRAALGFVEKMTRTPGELTPADAREVLDAGVTPEALTDAAAVGALFNIIARYSDALRFALPSQDEFDKAADMLLKRGYA